MNESNHKMTIHQERLAYRRAVTLCLERFFKKSPMDSQEIVEAWWCRMGKSEVYTSGLFMHDEPINTAADLAGVLLTPAVRDVARQYAAVIAESMPKSRKSRKMTSRRISQVARAA